MYSNTSAGHNNDEKLQNNDFLHCLFVIKLSVHDISYVISATLSAAAIIELFTLYIHCHFSAIVYLKVRSAEKNVDIF